MTSSNRPEGSNVADNSIRETIPVEDSTEETKVQSSATSTEETGSNNVVLQSSKYESSWIRRILTPRNCRWSDESPPALSIGHCLLYAMVSWSSYGTSWLLTIVGIGYHGSKPLLQPTNSQQDSRNIQCLIRRILPGCDFVTVRIRSRAHLCSSSRRYSWETAVYHQSSLCYCNNGELTIYLIAPLLTASCSG